MLVSYKMLGLGSPKGTQRPRLAVQYVHPCTNSWNLICKIILVRAVPKPIPLSIRIFYKVSMTHVLNMYKYDL